MLEHDSDAKQELRRADHLLYVTLKYTKTTDVIKNIIRRLINACDYSILDILEYLKEKGRIDEIPLTPLSRAEEIKKRFRKLEVIDFINFYLDLKKIDRAEYTRKEEFKKNVRLIVMDEEEESYEINIVKLYEFYERAVEFIRYVEENYK